MTAADSYELSMAVRLLLQAGREMQAAAARRMGLRVTDVQAMDLVTASGNKISPKELADRLGIRTASASVLIDRLTEAGHVRRTPVEQPEGKPRYRTNVSATEHARTEVRQTLKSVNDGFRELGAELTSEEAATVLDFLHRATDILHAYIAEAAEKPSEPAD
ncbi:winged helix-turn-helix transcriptional regulator [Microlunatus elymi]|uniref:Winged helix-turn-helix transcriptional regulator n=1 Tax=Microlunatus elymi TaxID=2596828 RepID=A0A516PW55_9ACTN|nr:MarR family winged helix-turn-helix transcriptional regulator [Microlunatus elymi]QDP95418.1 winged helix-turn-helix transcriptional regulator [Microlunatus elymi]